MKGPKITYTFFIVLSLINVILNHTYRVCVTFLLGSQENSTLCCRTFGEDISAVLCPAPDSLVQERNRLTGASRMQGHKDA